MSETLEVFTTTAGKRVKKIRTESGAIQRYAEGVSGSIDASTYGAYKSHKPDTERFKRGNKTEDINSVDDLGHPYDATIYQGDVKELEWGSDEREKAREINRWVGFKESEDTPDDAWEAAQEYMDMVDELEGVEDEEEQREIKRQYNVGGS